MRPASDTSRPDSAHPDAATSVKDGLGQHVWRLAEPRIIRRPIQHPSNPQQGFFYNLLLDHVPFRSLQTIRHTGTFLTDCIYHDIFTDNDQLNRHLQAYAEYNMFSETTLDKLRQGTDDVATQLMTNMLGALDAEHADQLRQEVLLGLQTQQELINDHDHDDDDDEEADHDAQGATPHSNNSRASHPNPPALLHTTCTPPSPAYTPPHPAPHPASQTTPAC